MVGSRPQVVERCAARGGRKWWLPSAESGAKLRSGQCPRRRRRRDEGRGECRMDEDGADRGIRHGGQTDNTTDGHAQGVHQPCGKPLYVAPTCELSVLRSLLPYLRHCDLSEWNGMRGTSGSTRARCVVKTEEWTATCTGQPFTVQVNAEWLTANNQRSAPIKLRDDPSLGQNQHRCDPCT